MIQDLKSGSRGNGQYTKASGGAVIITDVDNGEILSLVSYPSYDPNIFSGVITNKEWNLLNNDKERPIFNRATQGSYAPGSTFKMLVAMAGLESKNITSDELIEDTGVYQYGHRPVCWIYTQNRKTHGYINVSTAIKVSCNCYFYEVGRRMGIDKVIEFCKLFGLGSKTGIELEEATGHIAGANSDKWYLGDTLSAAIGQSYNSYTPVQIVNYISAIANGGKLNRLTLVKDVVDSNSGSINADAIQSYINTQSAYEFEEKNISVSEAALKVVKEGMYRSTSESGGGVYSIFKNSGLSVAGKTGTAEVGDGTSTALFAGFTPYINPEIAIVVVIEHGGAGNYAAEVARNILQEYYKIIKEDSQNISNQIVLTPGINF